MASKSGMQIPFMSSDWLQCHHERISVTRQRTIFGQITSVQGLLGRGLHTLRAAELAQAPDSTNAQASNQQGSKWTCPDPLPACRVSVISLEAYLTCPFPVVIMSWARTTFMSAAASGRLPTSTLAAHSSHTENVLPYLKCKLQQQSHRICSCSMAAW